MKHKITFLLLSCVFLAMFSCSKTKTYAELLKEENAAISRFIDEKELTIVYDLSEMDTLNEKVYYKISDSLYMHIISKGRPLNLQTGHNVYVRYVNAYEIKNGIDYSANLTFPYTFKYNIPLTYGGTDEYTFNPICEGIVIPLRYVGYGGKVSLIVPSKSSSTYFMNNVLPMYFQEVTYTMDPSVRPKD